MPKKAHITKKHTKTNKLHIVKGLGKYSKGGGSVRRPKIRGRGGYAEDIGGKVGNWLGQKAGGFLSSIFGLGSYDVKRNSLVKAMATDPPVVSNTAGGTRIQHREYIKDISGSIAFTNQSFAVNPGVAATFPWLSGVASSFEEYRMHGILFEFKSTSADALNSTNTALGTVILATEYNPLHVPFASKREMENYVYSSPTKPSESVLHPVECARDVSVLDELFIRNTPVTGADLRFSDIGNFQISTTGMQAAAVIGELWVTYDVELLKPKVPDSYTPIGTAHYGYTTTSPSLGSSAPTVSNLFGVSSAPKMVLQGLGTSPVSISTNTITFNTTGKFMILLHLSGSSTAVTDMTVTPPSPATGYTNANLLHLAGPANYVSWPPGTGTTTTRYALAYCINILDLVNPTVTFSSGTIPASITDADLFVFAFPEGFSAERSVSQIDQLQELVDKLSRKVADLNGSDDEKEFPDSPVLVRSETSLPAMTDSTVDLVRLLKNRLA